MKKVSAIIFSIGSAFVGSAITYFVTRHIFQKKLEKAVKAAQEDARVVYVPTTPTSSYINLSDLPPLKVEDLMKDYSPESENMDEKSQEIAHEEKHDEPDEESTDPYITTDEEFMDDFEEIMEDEINYDDGYRHGVVVYESRSMEIDTISFLILDQDLDTVHEYSLKEMVQPNFSDLTIEDESQSRTKDVHSLVSVKAELSKNKEF